MAFFSNSLFDSFPRNTVARSVHYQKQCQLHDQYIERLDHTETLGGHDSSGHHIGHSGCVNALSWSPSGQLLASGSDDRNVILWKLGSSHIHPVTDVKESDHSRSSHRYSTGASRRRPRQQPSEPHASTSAELSSGFNDVLQSQSSDEQDSTVRTWSQRNYPSMNLGMLGKIETGHAANIFSVKWAPNASERRLFTCAGDSHVRVFDINYMSAGTTHLPGAEGEVHRTGTGREYSVWPEHSGACVRLFRCHRGRAKRISTEVSPDVFLTCGEDGDVRQMDLRASHTCRSRTGGSCPPPLAHYPSVLYSLSVSKVEPWLFAVAGEAPLAYLHDRRMIPRLIKRDWGMSSSMIEQQQAALTMCVRSFGIPSGGFETPWAQDDGRTALIDQVPPSTINRRLLMGNRNSITACKLSEHNGRDLLVSYSSGHIYRFDIYDEPGILQANLDNVRFSLERSPTPPSQSSALAGATRTASAGGYDADLEKAEADPQSHDAEQEKRTVSLRINSAEMDGVNSDIEADDSIEGEDEFEVQVQDLDQDDDENAEEDADEDGNTDSDDEGDFSDDDLIHLLQEQDGQPQTSFNGGRDVPTVYPRSAYKGHCNEETVKDVAFAGGSDTYVISGSDDGNWFMWDKHTSEIKGIWHGDSSVVNVMAMHPDLPVFAISGIDDTIKVFAPITITPFAPALHKEAGQDTGSSHSKRPRTETRNFKVADRLADKEEICRRNEARLGRDLVSPAGNIIWRLHPQLLGINLDPDSERQMEGDCVVM